MATATATGTSGSGRSEVAETDSAEAKAAIKALEDDTTDWSEGEEVDSRFENPDKKSKAATDDDDSDLEDFDEDASDEVAEDADEDAEDEAADSENEQDEEDTDDAEDAAATDIEAERKRHNEEMAQLRIKERKAREAIAEAEKAREDADIRQYLEEAKDNDAELQRRQLQVEQFRLQEERIDLNTQRLESDVTRAMKSIDLFKTGSTAVKEELANAFEDFERQYIEQDKKGRPVRIKIDPSTGKPADLVAFIQRKADRIKQLQGDGRTRQDKSKKKEQARSITPPVRAPKKAKVDEDLAGFDEEAAK